MKLAELNAHELGAIVGAVAALSDVGVLALLGSGPRDLNGLVASTGCDALALDRVSTVLCAAGMLQRDGDVLSLTPALLSDGAQAPGGLAAVAEHYARTCGFLRSGERAPPMDGDVRERERAYAAAVSDLGRLFAESAGMLARELGPARRILDIGAGSGVWSLAMIAPHPLACVSAVDLAPVLPAFLARADALGLAQRVSTIAGDFHAVPLEPGAFDRVVLANVLHLDQEAAAQALVLRARRALAPAGELVVIDMLPTGPHGVLAHAAYELHLAMRTRAGRAHAQLAIEHWLVAAGLELQSVIPIEGRLRGLTALVARAPE